MASTIFQNCQRGTVFLCFLTILLFFIMNTISLIKKRLDPQEEDGEAGKQYKEKENKEETKPRDNSKAEESTIQFEQTIIKQSVIEESDTTIIKVIKKFHDLQMLYFPLLIVFPLNLVTGTSKAFQMVDFFFISITMILFNVLKIHHGCIEHKCLRVVLQNLWLILNFFLILNIWTTMPVSQPYIIV